MSLIQKTMKSKTVGKWIAHESAAIHFKLKFDKTIVWLPHSTICSDLFLSYSITAQSHCLHVNWFPWKSLSFFNLAALQIGLLSPQRKSNSNNKKNTFERLSKFIWSISTQKQQLYLNQIWLFAYLLGLVLVLVPPHHAYRKRKLAQNRFGSNFNPNCKIETINSDSIDWNARGCLSQSQFSLGQPNISSCHFSVDRCNYNG